MYNHQQGFTPGNPGFGRGWGLGAILRDVALAWRLIWDPSVPVLLKIFIPFLAFLYFVWPIDLMPGLPFDDIGVMLLAARLFVRLAAQGRGPNSEPGHADRKTGGTTQDDSDVIDTTWQVIDDK